MACPLSVWETRRESNLRWGGSRRKSGECLSPNTSCWNMKMTPPSTHHHRPLKHACQIFIWNNVIDLTINFLLNVSERENNVLVHPNRGFCLFAFSCLFPVYYVYILINFYFCLFCVFIPSVRSSNNMADIKLC